jgi:hypothetical protein
LADRICSFSLWCYHFSVPPLIAEPPIIPLPEPYNHPEWYGEIRVRYPDTGEVRSVGYGVLFKAKADLLVTMNESCYRLRGPRSDSLSSVLSRLREVSIWFSLMTPSSTPIVSWSFRFLTRDRATKWTTANNPLVDRPVVSPPPKPGRLPKESVITP